MRSPEWAIEAREHLDRAFDLYEDTQDYTAALETCDAALALDDRLSEAHNLRGVLLEALNRPREAVDAYRTALRIDPQFDDARHNLDELLWVLGSAPELRTIRTYSFPMLAHLMRARLGAAGIRAFVADDYIVAADWLYSRAVGGVKLQVAEHAVPAALAILDGDEARTIRRGPAAPASEPSVCPACGSANISFEKYARRPLFASWLILGFPLPFMQRHWHCNNCGHNWHSEIDVERGARPMAVSDLLENAKSAIEREDWQAARKAYEELLEQEPDNAEAHFGLGYVFSQQEAWDQAIHEYRMGLGIDPANEQGHLAHFDLAAAYVEQGRWHHAALEYEMVLNADPEDADARVALAYVYLQLERWDDAIETAQLALDIRPESAEAHVYLGQARGYKGQWSEAIRECEAALDIEPGLLEAHRALGIINARAMRWSDAERAFRKALSLDPEDADVHFGLGLMYMNAGEYAKAARELAESARLAPDNGATHYQLAEAYRQVGKDEEAQAEALRSNALGFDPRHPDAESRWH